MLVIADRGVFNFEFWPDCLLASADLLFRVAPGLKLPVIKVHPDGSYLSLVAAHKVRSSGVGKFIRLHSPSAHADLQRLHGGCRLEAAPPSTRWCVRNVLVGTPDMERGVDTSLRSGSGEALVAMC